MRKLFLVTNGLCIYKKDVHQYTRRTGVAGYERTYSSKVDE